MSSRAFLITALIFAVACATAGDNDGAGMIDANAFPGPIDAGGRADAKVVPDAMPGTPDAAPQAATCTEDIAIACGDMDQNSLLTANPSVGNYPCQEAPTNRAENVYRFSRATPGMVSVNLDVLNDGFLGDDFDLYVLSPMCETSGCVAQSANVGDDLIAFMAMPGQTYYFVVEEYGAGFFSFMDYDLKVDCP